MSLAHAGAMSLSSPSRRTLDDLPNLPGVKRDPSSINPTLFKKYIADHQDSILATLSRPQPSITASLSLSMNPAELEAVSQALSPYPRQVGAFDDLSGRFSMRAHTAARSSRTLGLPYSAEQGPPVRLGSMPTLNFLGYHLENVSGTSEPVWRARKVDLRFFTEDGTIDVIELKDPAAGITGRRLLRRGLVPRSTEAPVTPAYTPVATPGPATSSRGSRRGLQSAGIAGLTVGEAAWESKAAEAAEAAAAGANDMFSTSTTSVGATMDPSTCFDLTDIRLGRTLKLYHTVVTLIDADPFTRRYVYEQYGIDLGEGLAIAPEYDGSIVQAARSTLPKGTRSFSNPHPRDMEAGKGFFKYDGQVLRFHVILDAREKVFGEIYHFRMCYFLATDEIEILPMFERNDGKIRFPKQLSREKIPKNGMRITGTLEEDPEGYAFLHWRDFAVGAEINVLGSIFKVMDADTFTREFFNREGQQLGPGLAVEKVKVHKFARPVPPYNGFGTEEDSLATCSFSLIPVAPKKDGKKLRDNSGLILRFAARMLSTERGNNMRQFIFQFYLEDDSLLIHETPVRNSGFQGGTFLARDRIKRSEATGDFMTGGDLFVGRVIKVQHHEFELHDADEFTLRYMEAHPHMWPRSDVFGVVEKLRAREGAIRMALLRVGKKSPSGDLDHSDLDEVLRLSHAQLERQEVSTLLRALDARNTGKFADMKLLKMITEPDYAETFRRP